MRVQELIERLQTFPQDAVCIRRMCSENDELPEDEPILLKAEDKLIIKRHGRYMHYRSTYHPPDEKPEFVTVVYFEGN